MSEGRTGVRLKALAAIVAVMFASLGTRLWFLQVLAADEYRERARENRVRLIEVPAPRGRILDRRGELLVGNRQSLAITINRQEVTGAELEQVLFRLSELLEVPVETLVKRLADPHYYPFAPVPVAFDVPEELAFYVAERAGEFPGVGTMQVPVRTYPRGTLAAHVLGYLGAIAPEQLDDPEFGGYEPNDLVGQSGAEQTYEQDLRGEEGVRKLLVNAAGKVIDQIGPGQEPVPGHDVVLSIDARIQALAEESLALGQRAARTVYDSETRRPLRANGGAVVVMNPRNGQILAMVSSPGYDPRLFLDRLTQAELDRLNNPAANRPLLNRAVQGEYPPGSAFKPFVALSAMTAGIASPAGAYNCSAEYTAPGDESGTVFHNWTDRDLGFMTLERALVLSCDTVFYQFGWDFWVRYFHSGPEGRRDEPFQDRLREFGFGQPTNADVPFERGGRIPDAEWKREIHERYPELFPFGDWFPGDYINMTIGQGDTLVTPLQLAVAYSALANGGTLWAPRVALRVQEPDGEVVRRIRPQEVARLPFTRGQLSYVLRALAQVPVSGTAREAFLGFPLAQVPVAGKTGTAEVRPYQDYSWFAAIAPADDPRYVIVALVEQGGHGSTTAAPVVRRILEGLFGLPLSSLTPGGETD